jgi:hypothetical protein
MTRSSRDSGYQDLEELRVRLAEFRSTNRSRTRLPEELWRAAAEIAAQRGMKITSRVLHLDTNSLRKWMDKQGGQAQRPAEPKRMKRKYTRRKAAVMETPATFLELLAPSPGSAAICIVEVESPRGGKLRMELKGVATSEITQLIQAFAGQ